MFNLDPLDARPNSTYIVREQVPASPMPPIISVSHLSKTYASGFHALKDINLEIRRGEIFGLLEGYGKSPS